MTRLEAVQADITTVAVDVIVNAANSSLMGGGGVDGAIHRAGGPGIKEECKAIIARQGPLPTGEAAATGAGNLPARHVVHTVGPVWGTMPAEEAVDLLAACYRNSLSLARDLACRSIAFPNISTGVYHFPKPLAAGTAHAAVSEWIEHSPDALDLVLFVCFGSDNLRLYQELLGH